MFQTTRAGLLYNPGFLSTWRIETHKQRSLHNLHHSLHLNRASWFDRVDDWMTAFQQRVPKFNFETMFVKRVDICVCRKMKYLFWFYLFRRRNGLLGDPHWLLYFLPAITPATGDKTDFDLYKCLLLIFFLQVVLKENSSASVKMTQAR